MFISCIKTVGTEKGQKKVDTQKRTLMNNLTMQETGSSPYMRIKSGSYQQHVNFGIFRTSSVSEAN